MRHSRGCCSPSPSTGLTLSRREFLGTAVRSALSVGAIGLLAACVEQPASLPRVGGLWVDEGVAPFSRHAHSAAAVGDRLLVMGQRRGVLISDSEDDGGEVDKTIHFFGNEFEFMSDVPAEVSSGERVRVVFTNEGLVDHDLTFSVAGVYLHAGPGETTETIAEFEQPEVYFCSIGGHAEAGMVGDLVVDGESPDDQEVGPGDGSTEMWWFDPVTRSWSEAPPLGHAYDHITLLSLSGDVYSIGGFTGDIGSSRADVYMLAEGSSEWVRRADLPVARGAMAGATDGDKIYVVGGRSEAEGTPSSKELYIYDPATDTWDSGPEMPTGRDHIAGAMHEGVFWVIGGRGNGERVDSTPVSEGYDTSRGEWISGSPPPKPASANGLAVLHDRIVLFGGEGPAPTPAGAAGQAFDVYPETIIYDPRADTWARAPNAVMAVHHPAYDVIGEAIYIVGGGPVSGVSSTATVQSFRLAN